MVDMKGITQKMRELGIGEQVRVEGMERASIYLIARRVGIKVRVEQVRGGFNVTRVGLMTQEDMPITSVPVANQVEVSVESKEARLARAREAMASAMTAKPKPVETTSVSDSSMWVEQAPVLENGDWTIYERHIKTGVKRLVRVEKSFDAA